MGQGAGIAMHRTLLLFSCLLLSACTQSGPDPTPTNVVAVPSATLIPTEIFRLTSTTKSTVTPTVAAFTPLPANTPWKFPSGLSIEEHPLATQPEIEPLVILPFENLSQTQVLDKHKDLWESTLSPHEYNHGGDLWAIRGDIKLEPVWGPMDSGKLTAQVKRNGVVIFSTLIEPPGTMNPFRVLTVYDNHWVFEIAQEKEPIPPNTQQVDSFFKGEIFVDGQSINDLHGYEESFGFQTIHGRPFYFYKRNDKTGISFDGQEIDLGYDGVWHYGCCSGGALNPRTAQNIIGFFAWRAEHWFYTETGVFDQP
jgi:hypothetical protein